MTKITLPLAALGAILCLGGTLAQAQDDSTTNQLWQKYCTDHGGVVDERYPAYGTNDPNPLQLSGVWKFCMFTSKKDGSRIYAFLDTLFSVKPTLATLAYYSQTPYQGGGGGSPASYYCSQLGGTDLFGGVNEAGGGWVAMNPKDVDQTLDTCIFPDMSTIDSWGLLYHSVNIIRGTDLSKVIRYPNPYKK
jgi:putative hemolysin